MNRTVSTIVAHYAELVPVIAKALKRNDHVFLVCDDSFAPEAQIWTPADRRAILADYAHNANSTTSGRGFRAEMKAVNDAFDNSREVFHVSRADLAEITRNA